MFTLNIVPVTSQMTIWRTTSAVCIRMRYLSGMIAAEMSPTGKLGYVGAYNTPEVVRGINAFALGARAVNPDATVTVVWTNTWYDPSLERQGAVALLDQGVDGHCTASGYHRTGESCY